MGHHFRVMAMATALLLAPLAMLSVTPGRISAQTVSAPVIEILHVAHDASGTLLLGIRAGGGRQTNVQSLTVFIDDVPVTLDLASRAVRRDLALVVLIDTSGSMDGAPIRAARDAGRELIQRLSAGDRVGLTSFATNPVVRSPLTRDRAAVLATIDSLRAEGATALYEAVAAGVAQLPDAPNADRVVVLLSDGRDSGGTSVVGREGSIQRVRESGVSVYAIGLGPDYDEAYLVSLATESGGRFFAVRDEHDVAALSSLFAQLGGALGSNETYTIPISSLARGTHHLSVRGLINGGAASASATFEVSNAGLLRPSVAQPAAPGEPIEVLLGPVVAHQDLAFEARIQGLSFLPNAPGSPGIELDPWRLSPGTQEVELVALVRGAVAAREVVRVEVPALLPAITVVKRDGTTVVRGLLQGPERPTVVARSGKAEMLRGTGELTLQPGDRQIDLQLLDASGTTVLTREIPPAGGVKGRPPAASALAFFVAVVLGVAWLRLRSRRLKRSRLAAVPSPVLRRIARQTAPVAAPSTRPQNIEPIHPREELFGTIRVCGTTGTSHEVALTRRPITVGSAPGCDIVLDDPEIRSQHARITVLSANEVQVHALGEHGSRPYLEREEDEWLVVNHGEQIVLGTHSLQLLMTHATFEEMTVAGQSFDAHAEAGV